MERVYLETTVIGNLTGRLHPDPRVSIRQEITREWWSIAPQRYQLVTSQLAHTECGAGDAQAASERLRAIAELELLEITPAARELATSFIRLHAVPRSQPRDALHLAIVAVHGIEFLATWNFKHILNPHTQAKIEKTCRDSGYLPPVICTPEQLWESDDGS
ncbi:MAG TPA: type II toxin-antitoxin system VapC family toxin [Pirellulaceae bacterium]|jgi:predicted nucleic acid-binding protein|nr:type II toxin-antitoxin system VapC family toxin [Pirellulaceae bacterium]